MVERKFENPKASEEQSPEVNSTEQSDRSPLDVMNEILREVYPVPEPPADAPWLNKSRDELTDGDKKAQWDYMMECQMVIANSPQWIPHDHPRYNEYEFAKRDYLSLFRLSPQDLLQEFTI